MVHQKFINQVVEKIKTDEQVIGLAAGGSFIDQSMDEFSDLDLVLITTHKIAPDADKMLHYAGQLGNLLNGFTGEHVGERRLLICLYDNPLLHVDIKFLTIDEFSERVENPVVLWERDGQMTAVLESTPYHYPYPDYQWIEDRFWTWIHYATLKIGRGELFEALDFTSFLRVIVISSLLQIKNGRLPRALRKVETGLEASDFEKLKETVASYDKASVAGSLDKMIVLYLELRKELFPESIVLRKETEEKCMAYFREIKNRV